jgi:hypothetical protein
VLDPKRSNAINIGLTVLPTARTIKGAILKMDSSVINKEGIEVSRSPTTSETKSLLCVFACEYHDDFSVTIEGYLDSKRKEIRAIKMR